MMIINSFKPLRLVVGFFCSSLSKLVKSPESFGVLNTLSLIVYTSICLKAKDQRRRFFFFFFKGFMLLPQISKEEMVNSVLVFWQLSASLMNLCVLLFINFLVLAHSCPFSVLFPLLLELQNHWFVSLLSILFVTSFTSGYLKRKEWLNRMSLFNNSERA